jgi:hypothetical protein
VAWAGSPQGGSLERGQLGEVFQNSGSRVGFISYGGPPLPWRDNKRLPFLLSSVGVGSSSFGFSGAFFLGSNSSSTPLSFSRLAATVRRNPQAGRAQGGGWCLNSPRVRVL